MFFKYLGTAAAEGIPGLFCNCEVCNIARSRGGKDIRTRSQALVGDDLLIDFPADTYQHILRYGLRLDRIRYLLVTHSHNDHFYPADLALRGMDCAHDMQCADLDVYCNEAVAARFYAENPANSVKEHIRFHLVEPYQCVGFGKYKVWPLPTKHMKTETAMIYVLQCGGKTIFYGNDTGIPAQEVLDFIAAQKFVFDFVSLDCTFGSKPINGDSHMSLSGADEFRRQLQKTGAVNDKSVLYVTHFSHNGRPLHEEMVKAAAAVGFSVAYDGLEINV